MGPQQALERARRAQQHNAQQRRRDMIREVLAGPRAKHCACGLRPGSTDREIRELGAGCTAGMWVCPTLDAVRRRLG